MFEVLQTRRFLRQYKQLPSNIIQDVDVAIKILKQHPEKGKGKKGNLIALQVYKFYSQNQHYLLGYTVDKPSNLIYLAAIAVHGNFYRNLKC